MLGPCGRRRHDSDLLEWNDHWPAEGKPSLMSAVTLINAP